MGGCGELVGGEEWCMMQSLQLVELAKHIVDCVECHVYFLLHLHM